MDRRTIGRVASIAAVLTLGSVGYTAARRRNVYYDGPPADHFDGTRFFVPGHPTDRNAAQLLRWQTEGGRTKWPAAYPSPFRDKPPERSQALRVVLVGHASLLVQVGGANLLVDPVWSPRASPFRIAGPRRINAPGIDFDDLPPVDAVLLTHNHYDHLDVATLSRLWERFEPRVIAPLGNDAVIAARDDAITVETLDWQQSVGVSGLGVHLVPAYHWSARSWNDRRMALWGGFVLTTPGGVVYLAGDTGYGGGELFRDVRDRFGPPRLAVLPIGAYEPRWFMAAQHMNPAEAVQAFRDLGAESAIGVHWGTFQLTNEGVDEPERDLASARDEAEIAPERFRAFRPGEVWTTDGNAAAS